MAVYVDQRYSGLHEFPNDDVDNHLDKKLLDPEPVTPPPEPAGAACQLALPEVSVAVKT